MHLLPGVEIHPNLELKTRPKPVLGSLPLAFALPGLWCEDVRKRKREREKEGEREGEGEGERERKRCRICPEIFLFLKGMTGALAPFSYLI